MKVSLDRNGDRKRHRQGSPTPGFAQKIHGNNGLDALALRLEGGEGLLEEIRVHIARFVSIHEHGLGAGLDDRIRRGSERHGGGKNEIALPDACGEQAQVEGRGAGGQRDGMGAAIELGQLGFEGINLGA